MPTSTRFVFAFCALPTIAVIEARRSAREIWGTLSIQAPWSFAVSLSRLNESGLTATKLGAGGHYSASPREESG
jgi:hypothetical protein